MSGLGRDARRLVERARETGGPTAVQRDRMRRALLRRAAAAGILGAAAGATKGAAAATAAAGPGTVAVAGWKVGLVALVVTGGVATGAWVATTPAEVPEPAAAPAPRLPEPVPATPIERERVAPADVSAEAPELEPEDAETLERPTPRRTGPAPAPPPPESEPPAPEALAPQVALLAEAVEAIGAGEPERALALLDRHEHLYPASPLARERADARVRAEAALAEEAAP